MIRLPAISGAAAVKALGRIGYQVDHQTGSHVILRKTDRFPEAAERRKEIAGGVSRRMTVVYIQ